MLERDVGVVFASTNRGKCYSAFIYAMEIGPRPKWWDISVAATLTANFKLGFTSSLYFKLWDPGGNYL